MTETPEVREQRIDTGRLGLHVLRAIPARPAGRVMLLGGSNFDLRLKRRFLDSALVRTFDVVTFEPRGIGRSDSPDGDWTMETYADDALSLLDAVGWDRVNVVGESFGGMTALHMALRAPDRVACLAVASAPAGGAKSASIDLRALLDLPEAERARAALLLQDSALDALERDDPDAFQALVAERRGVERAFAASTGPESYRRLLTARAGHDVSERLSDIPHATHVIVGARDRQAPVPAQTALAAGLPNADLMVYDAGHGVAFETPGPMIDLCAAWSPVSQGEAVDA